VLTGVGPLTVTQPRVDDRPVDDRPVDDRRADEDGVRFRFTAKILPPHLRKTKAIEDPVPWLHLREISSGEMGDALVHLGFDRNGLSAATVTRMTEVWQAEYAEWNKRDLTGKRYVYLWADGIYFGVRFTGDRPCVLFLMNATEDGTKELAAVRRRRFVMTDGQRESQTSWTALLDAKNRGLTEAPELATGDGSLGFWLALAKVFPETRHQRCWVHKTANLLDKLPMGEQPGAKAKLHEIRKAGTRGEATGVFDEFVAT